MAVLMIGLVIGLLVAVVLAIVIDDGGDPADDFEGASAPMGRRAAPGSDRF
jgi:hypothetical protein